MNVLTRVWEMEYFSVYIFGFLCYFFFCGNKNKILYKFFMPSSYAFVHFYFRVKGWNFSGFLNVCEFGNFPQKINIFNNKCHEINVKMRKKSSISWVFLTKLTKKFESSQEAYQAYSNPNSWRFSFSIFHDQFST